MMKLQHLGQGGKANAKKRLRALLIKPVAVNYPQNRLSAKTVAGSSEEKVKKSVTSVL